MQYHTRKARVTTQLRITRPYNMSSRTTCTAVIAIRSACSVALTRSVPVTFRREPKIDKREAQNDACLIATMLAQGLRPAIGYSPLRPQRFDGRYIFQPGSVPRLEGLPERPCPSLW